ncbi:hypothetical protein [Deinococcus aquiradiocola]|uniref:Uncharacterized protein n=1 Tax=Deinococcus aquiradiocola TaxID=393059 RepID=A0A917UQN4_9DEIO|nr:hypothetical protein [Deinococcus aquiradiocola]GGJ76227.1 hypothetical protein GCM10008939_20520 [Deinococcus aquiradiocola]
MLYRHGDVLVQQVQTLPDSHPRPGVTLAHGEVTGHSHRFSEPGSVQLHQSGRDLYVQVLTDHADLIHEEHRTIRLPRGVYRVWMQREYTPAGIRRVYD